MNSRLFLPFNLRSTFFGLGGLIILSGTATFFSVSNQKSHDFNLIFSSFDSLSKIFSSTFQSFNTFFSSSLLGFFTSFPSKFSEVPKKIGEYWSSPIQTLEGIFKKIGPFFPEFFTGLKTEYEFISKNITIFAGWIKSGWDSLLPELKKISEHFKTVQGWFSKNEIEKHLKTLKERFRNFFTHPFQSLSYFLENFYRVTFKFVLPWGWSFLEEAVVSEQGLKKLFEYLKKDKEELKKNLRQFFKFFHKYQFQLKRMDHETRKSVVKKLLENPEEFFKIIEALNQHNSQGGGKNTLSFKEIKKILKKPINKVKEELAIRSVGKKIEEGVSKAINSAKQLAKNIENKILNNNSKNSISDTISKVAEDVASDAISIGTDLFSEAWSLFGGIFNQEKKQKKP